MPLGKQSIPPLVVFLIFVALGQTAEPVKARLAVALFEVPEGLSKEISPSTLTSLLLGAGKKSKRLQVLAPDEYLRKIVERYRTELQTGALKSIPKDVDPKRINAERLLIPSVSRFGDRYVVTATLQDMKTFQVIDTYKLDAKGKGDVVLDLIDQLWQKVDVAREGWKYTCGDGVYLGPFLDEGRLTVATLKHWIGLDAATGKELWKHQIAAGFVPYQLAATGGHALLVHGPGGAFGAPPTLQARALATGREAWSRSLGRANSRWVAASAGRVYYVDDRYQLNALDVATSKVVWAAVLPAEKYDSYSVVPLKDRVFALHPGRVIALNQSAGEKLLALDSIWEGAHHPVPQRPNLSGLVQAGERLFGYRDKKFYSLHQSGKAGFPAPLVPEQRRPIGKGTPLGSLPHSEYALRPLVTDDSLVFVVLAREQWHGHPGLSETAKFQRVELHVSVRTARPPDELVWHRQVVSSSLRANATGPAFHGDMIVVGLGDHLYGLDRKTGTVAFRREAGGKLVGELLAWRGLIIYSLESGAIQAIEP